MEFRAVIFDWRETLVVTQAAGQWARDAFDRIGRSPTPETIEETIRAVRLANGPNNRLDAPEMDSDAARHRSTFMRVFQDAELDEDLAEAMYASESDFCRNPFAEDVERVLHQLNSAGIAVIVLSDIHFDIRPAFVEAELSQFVDGYVLSFEVHAQKPDPVVFAAALNTAGCSADETLMVGDRSRPDGGAVELGITTLLLPTLQATSDHRLHHVLALCGLSF